MEGILKVQYLVHENPRQSDRVHVHVCITEI